MDYACMVEQLSDDRVLKAETQVGVGVAVCGRGCGYGCCGFVVWVTVLRGLL